MDGEKQLVTFDEACQVLGKTYSQGRWMLRNGDFPQVAKIGGRVMTRQSDIDAYLAAKFADVA